MIRYCFLFSSNRSTPTCFHGLLGTSCGIRDSFWWQVSYLQQVSQVSIISFNLEFMFSQNMVSCALRKQLSVPRCEACSFRFMSFHRLTGTTICCLWNITPSCTDNLFLTLKLGVICWYLSTIVGPATQDGSFQGLQYLVILSCLLDSSESRCGYREERGGVDVLKFSSSRM